MLDRLSTVCFRASRAQSRDKRHGRDNDEGDARVVNVPHRLKYEFRQRIRQRERERESHEWKFFNDR